MSQIVKPHGELVALTLAEAAVVNDQINTIYNDHNGGITDFNINSLANINQGKILNLIPDLNTIRSSKAGSINVVSYTVNLTYAKPGALLFARIITIGGGGGGGAAASSANGLVASGGGGGSGAYSESWVLASAIAPVEIITIGQGGLGGTTNGTVTSFGSLVGANGGFLGQSQVDSIGSGGAGGIVGGGQIAIAGVTGGVGFITTAPTGLACGGYGGAAGPYMGPGAAVPTVTAAAGGAGTLGGGGAGGACVGVSSAAGGNGGGGLVIVVEFRA